MDYEENGEVFGKNCIYCSEKKTYRNRVFACDGHFNCSSYSKVDSFEEYCGKKQNSKFECLNSEKEIDFFKVCNHVYDCQDKSDERHCS